MAYPKVGTDAPGGDDASTPAGVNPSPRFPQIEERVLRYWEHDGTFVSSVEQRDPGPDGANEFVFYDGPPFANGLPHYGHLLTGYVKDVVPRYETMRGRRVERRFGWDTHGLPAELEAAHQLGLKTKKDIEELGIETFNKACRESVLKYTDEWRDYVTRQARWVDFDNDYKTMNLSFMESVIWAFKQLWDKGLVYEGKRVLPYCWKDETPLSNHELRMDEEVYQNRQDPAVTVGLPLETGELALIWTTTPWTLPSNMAIAVGADVDYVVVEAELPFVTAGGAGDAGDAGAGPRRYLLAQARLAAYAREFGDADHVKVVARLKGADLVGRRYAPPFDYFADSPGAHRILAADFVTTEDGTGLVHLAGGFGEDDMAVTAAHGIASVTPVDAGARFTAPVLDYLGLHVFDANPEIIDHLKAATRGEGSTGSVTPGTVLLRRETHDHSYPHCWRCKNPLIYMAVSSWFVEVTRFKDRMGELNQQIRWTPGHIRDGQFGKWLANARDWSISRNRFWGSPIPVWRSDDMAYPRIDVYGSIAELERDFGVEVTDLHRPFIDNLTRPNPDDPTGRSVMRRVPDVLDVWFDSGSMPFAQVHYPFENREWFEHHYPGDFIVEYIGQTRGWFYTLHILATALFDRPAFTSCISHGIVLGSDGQKMSKSLRNYPDVAEVFQRDGADAMRWFLMSSPILRGGNLIVTEQGIRDGVRQVMIPLWNSWYFFALYANAAAGGAGYEAKWSTASTDVLDRYLLAKLREFVERMQDQLDRYEIADACETMRGFLDVLTNWYIRRSRDRFWDAGNAMSRSTTDAFDTLYTALEVLTRAVAPLLPLTTEEIWRGLTGGRSVHLTDWPNVADLPADHALVVAMDRAREVCSTALGLRKQHGLRARQPLTRLTVVVPHAEALEGFAGIVADEVNVREVVLEPALDGAVGADGAGGAAGAGVTRRLTVNARAAGPRLGRDVQAVIKAAKSGDWAVGPDGTVTAGGVALVDGEYTLDTVVAQDTAATGTATAMLADGGFVVLDIALTDELRAEGLANDVVRAVQDARKKAELHISDRIEVTVAGSDRTAAAVTAHRERIAAEVLADRLSVAVLVAGEAAGWEALGGAAPVEADLSDGETVRIALRRVGN